jgi:hypothetical protein
MTHLLLVAVALACACSSPSVRGGDPVPAGREPKGNVTANYVTKDCKDSSGHAWEQPVRVFVVKDEEGFELLVAARSGYDSLVIRNHFDEAGETVFQAVLDSTAGHPVLHDFRIPKKSGAEGRMAIALTFTETENSEGVLRAQVKGAAIVCRLGTDDTDDTDAGTPDAT